MCIRDRFALDTALDDDVSHGAGLPYLHHFEVRLWRATFGTKPIVRNIRPSRPRRNTIIRQAFFLVVDEATGHALPLMHRVHKKSLGLWGRGARQERWKPRLNHPLVWRIT